MLAFAHNSHLQRGKAQWQLGTGVYTWWPVGSHLNEIFGSRYAVIGSAVGGITFTIKDGETGLLVPPKKPEALAMALKELLSQPERCIEMGQAARQRVEHEFTWSIVAMRTAALYETLLAERRNNNELIDISTLSLASLPATPEMNPLRRDYT